MLFAAAVSFVGLVCLIPPCFALDSNPSVFKPVNWANGHIKYTEEDVFVGLSAFAFYHEGEHSSTIKFRDSSACESRYGDDGGYSCQQCIEAGEALQASTIVSVVSQLGQIATDLQRSTVAGDVNCQKSLAIFTGILGFATAAFSLYQFRVSCWSVGFVWAF